MNLLFDPDSNAALEHLETGSDRPTLLAKVNVVLNQLETNPGDRLVRHNRFTNGLWCVVIRDRDEDWWLLWEPHSDKPDGIMIHYLGLSPR